MSTPSIGRIVHYTLLAVDAQRITEQFPRGNPAREGDTFPAVIVRVLSDQMVNLQVMIDGPGSYWATSRSEGEGQGAWHWPPRA